TEDPARLGRVFCDQDKPFGVSYLSNRVPMARSAPQAKNSTISAVSTMLAMNRFNISHLRKLALRQAFTADLAIGRRQNSSTGFDVQFSLLQSKCAQSGPPLRVR